MKSALSVTRHRPRYSRRRIPFRSPDQASHDIRSIFVAKCRTYVWAIRELTQGGSMNRIDLHEIAKIYRKHPKTFLRYVRKLNIPHIKLGGSMLFDPNQVERFLEEVTQAQPLLPDLSAKPLPKKRTTPTRQAERARYAELLGLESF